MSGGSYDYLCYKEISRLINSQSDLESMQERLSGLGYAEDAAQETMQLIQSIRQFERLTEVLIERLRPVWRSVEWWDSADISEDWLKVSLYEYRNLTNKPYSLNSTIVVQIIKSCPNCCDATNSDNVVSSP